MTIVLKAISSAHSNAFRSSATRNSSRRILAVISMRKVRYARVAFPLCNASSPTRIGIIHFSSESEFYLVIAKEFLFRNYAVAQSAGADCKQHTITVTKEHACEGIDRPIIAVMKEWSDEFVFQLLILN
ncbi:uncharacterized protein LOC143356869 [Halictus rubicundus]|uniref:uncharacterized protein LOC143356869 n=1 Tax=Halictus rubicundus TaxID=77578 RepID=UPI004035DF07